MAKGKAKTRGKKRKKKRKPGLFGRDSKCRFCRSKATSVDYKDLSNLMKLVTPQGKMFSRKRSGNCARHQRMVKRAVKLARFMALLPYVG
ncbi:MAG TPA: 30S ribosomal protein S18 [Planctomycetota bacterium]|nr:30S ribosomal protein S18 [Planctomycetota bacterium]HUV38786.1 30S ribosomal protein S18 [Planctomycetota bacterium]